MTNNGCFYFCFYNFFKYFNEKNPNNDIDMKLQQINKSFSLDP